VREIPGEHPPQRPTCTAGMGGNATSNGEWMGLKMVDGEAGSDGARLVLGIMRGDKDVFEGVADGDRVRSPRLVG
jgi:hypothetical protein